MHLKLQWSACEKVEQRVCHWGKAEKCLVKGLNLLILPKIAFYPVVFCNRCGVSRATSVAYSGGCGVLLMHECGRAFMLQLGPQ